MNIYPIGFKLAGSSNLNQDPILNSYLREIGQSPLLTPEREVELARKIKSGWKYAKVNPSELSAYELAELRDIEIAKEEFTQANLRLVVSIAKKYHGLGIPLADLIQEGNIGLMRAIDKFDVDKGFKFSTYATHWIRQAISNAINGQSRSIRVPGHVKDQLVELTKVRRELEQALGREPTVSEIAKALNVSISRYEELSRLLQDVVSLETPVSQDGEATIMELYSDVGSEEVGESLIRQDVAETLERAFSILTEHERQILRFRFGLEDKRVHNLEETAKRFAVTKERVRQIEARAINRLRRPETVAELKALVQD